MREAIEHFARRLRFETDVSDVHSALAAGDGNLVVVDSRGDQAWAQGHIPGAVHLPTADIAARARHLVDPGREVVTYCWGPGCNGATRAALEFAQLGYRVREMIGGFEYWVREGLAFETSRGPRQRPADGLTAPHRAVSCDC
ncbi:rhodanese-like domain-containing protein [Dactylosporangium sp. CA-139114]|uniref:rhodanese-like domain-containing protein n=1 Tax=Dactylosporangium sp. CA-139114 TaxID=3239931 RepID=UPI003D962984